MVSPNSSYNELYELAISFIKFHEGFAGGKAYYCAAGYKTIGYGHVVKPTEIFPERITLAEADRLLRRDFDFSIRCAQKYSPQLKGAQLLAVAHFCFAKGPGNYESSTLRKLINQGIDPTDEFRKWCKYRTPQGVMVKSRYSLNIREWEICMYNNSNQSDTYEFMDDLPLIGIDSAEVNYISEI